MWTDNLVDLLDQVKARPALYLSRNSISCLKAFLDGWQLRRPDEIADPGIIVEIQSRVECTYGIAGHSWDKILLLFSQDEGDALSRFFSIFDEAMASRELQATPDPSGTIPKP